MTNAYLNDSRRAAEAFGGSNAVTFTTIPRFKHIWFIKFIRPTVNPTSQDWTRNFLFKAKTVEKPKINYGTEMLNEYNKKRQIHTRLEYLPVSVRFHDTADDMALNLFLEYSRYYWNDWTNKSDQAWSYDQTAAVYNQGPNNTDWGFNINNKNLPDSNFFTRIEIYQVYGGFYLQTDMINPKITTFIPDTLDYSAGGEIQEITMTFAYEGIYQYDEQPLTQDLITEFGLTFDAYTDQIPGSMYGSLPIEARVANQTSDEPPDANSLLSTSDLINQAVQAAALSGRPLSIYDVSAGAGSVGNLNNLLSIADTVNQLFQSPVSASALSVFGDLSFNGLPNQDQNDLIAQTFNIANATGALSSIIGNLVNQNNAQFPVGVAKTTNTQLAIQQAASTNPPSAVPSTTAPKAATTTFSTNPSGSIPPTSAPASATTPIPTFFAVQTASSTPVIDQQPSPFSAQNPTPPSNFITNNVGTNNLLISAGLTQGLALQAAGLPNTTQSSTPAGYYNPGVSGALYDIQLGKVSGVNGAAPYAQAIASTLTAAATAGAFTQGGAVNTLQSTQLNAIVVQSMNASRSPTSQVGYRTQYPNVPYAPYGVSGSTWSTPNPNTVNVNNIPVSGTTPGAAYGIPPSQPPVLPWQAYSPIGALISAEENNPAQPINTNV
jgi:hypothetical protein